MLNKLSLNKVLSVVDDMLVVIIILVTTFSFFIGVFLVFFTNVGDVVQWHSDVPLDFLILGLFGLSSINFNLGISFVFFLIVYLACYIICFLKPIPIFQLSSVKKPFRMLGLERINIQRDNYLAITISWFSGYFVLSILIDVIQQLFGVTLGNPLTANPLLSFFYLTAAPLNEEIFFRVILLGLPLFILFVPFGKGLFLSTLYHPYKNVPYEKGKYTTLAVAIIIVLNSLAFGLSHVLFGGGYELGKITQAALGGVIIAWLYYRYSLSSAITFHWISNFVFFAYSIFGFFLFKSPWNTESDNIFLAIVSVVFIVMGIIFLYGLTERLIKKYLKKSKI
ncbi:CAAX amino terminal protease self- immunity [Candidatus Nitrosocosmicus oleophilus]|uniref:CAAX amino terminal protease self- immunity n=1 Tax=Candidatus Nitrosocosmicus oleophilus TaxID=1353260 RepID=A0A654M191_9ARCH|nr:CAAX amino terminal protease self- immunity [Candidatus Nitrosocosmicus oleophilus]